MRAPDGAQAGEGRWPRPALVAVSLAAHVLVLGGLGLGMVGLPAPRPAATRIILLEIEPRPPLPGEAVHTPRRAPPSAEAPRPVAADAAATVQPPRDPDEPPTPPAPRLAAPVPGAAPPPDAAPWRVRPRTLGERIGRGLRTRIPGCAFRDALTGAEQAICDDRFGERAAAAAPIAGTGDPERDAAFAAEGARALARYEARRRPLSGGVGVVGPGDCPGANLGAGCAGQHLPPEMRLGAQTTINSAGEVRSGVQLKLGPLEIGRRD